MHALGEAQDTPSSACDPLSEKAGRFWIFHTWPFHLSARACRRPPLRRYEPTAVHDAGDGHDTATSEADPVPAGSLIGWITQPAPLQIPVTRWPPLPPTATHRVADGHETSFRCPNPGMGWMTHEVPFHRSARGRER